jgi:CheY-like chemotaxis protein
MKLDQITGELLNRAIEVYVSHAYRAKGSGTRQIPRFEPNDRLPAILAAHTNLFEDLSGTGTPGAAGQAGAPTPRMYALRLGNAAYPHMKLAIVEAFFGDEFVFAVDRHDTFHFDPDVPGYQAWCELKEINRLVKESIEGAWHKAGLPTLRGLREERFSESGLAPKLRAAGHTILVLDDDQARAEILRGIFGEAGYEVVIGPPGPQPNPDDTVVRRARKRARGESLRLPASACRGADDVRTLCELIVRHAVALVLLDVSYRTGQGPRVGAALHLDPRGQDIPILGIYSRRDFGPDPEIFDVSIRRPYRTEDLLRLVRETLVHRGSSGSGLRMAVRG